MKKVAIFICLVSTASFSNYSCGVTSSAIILSPNSQGAYMSWGKCITDNVSSLSGNKSILFKPGTYKMDSVNMSNNMVTISSISDLSIRSFDTTNLAEIDARVSNNGSMPAYVFRLLDCERTKIHHLKFEGYRLKYHDGDFDYHSAIRIEATPYWGEKGISVEHCVFKGFKTGAIHAEPGWRYGAVKNCYFDAVDNRRRFLNGSDTLYTGDFGAVHVDRADSIEISNNIIVNQIYSGFSSKRSSRLWVHHNHGTFDPNAEDHSMGFNAEWGLNNSTIEHNTFNLVKSEGIIITSEYVEEPNEIFNNHIEYNQILNTYGFGIVLNHYKTTNQAGTATPEVSFPAHHNYIQRNKITAFDPEEMNQGIMLNHAYENVVYDNEVFGASECIYWNEEGRDNEISFNTLINCRNHGIRGMGGGNIFDNLIDSKYKGIDINGPFRYTVTRNTIDVQGNAGPEISWDAEYAYFYSIYNND